MKWYGYAAFAFALTLSVVSVGEAAESLRSQTTPPRGKSPDVHSHRTASVAQATPKQVKPIASANSRPGTTAPRVIAPQSIARVEHVELAEVSHPHHHGMGFNAYTQGATVAPWRGNNPWAGSWPVPYAGYVYYPGICDHSAPCTSHLWDGYVQSPCRCHPHGHCARGCNAAGSGCSTCQQGNAAPVMDAPGPIPTPAPAPEAPPAAPSKAISTPLPVVISDDIGQISDEPVAEGEQSPAKLQVVPAYDAPASEEPKEARSKLTKMTIRSVSVPLLKPAR